MKLSAQALFDWARGYSKRSEDAGKGTQYPTLREATKRFRCTLDDIEDVIGDDIDGDHHLGLVTAWGVSSGIAEIESRGEYQVEAY